MHAPASPVFVATLPGLRGVRWAKSTYNRLTEIGLFDDSPSVYLFRGELVEEMAIGRKHARAQTFAGRWATFTFVDGVLVRQQLPLDVPGDSMPQPDVAVVTLAEDARDPHPNSALLVIEIAATSLDLDRTKAAEYAAADVPDYWVLDVEGRVLEVRRDVADDPASPTGKAYATFLTFGEDDAVAPLAAPDAQVTPRVLMDGA